jgi:hypothetical protein
MSLAARTVNRRRIVAAVIAAAGVVPGSVAVAA